METTPARPKFVRWAVMLGIVIALNLFVMVVRSIVIPEPKYDEYCPTMTQPVATEAACKGQDGIWVETPGVGKSSAEGYCDVYQKCQPLYDAAWKQHQLYAFVIMVGFGILAIIAGVIPMGSSIVSTGLSYGGVLALVVAAGQYWNSAGTLIQLAISVIALAALIYIGARRFKD